jgi:hypothetical protein
MTSALQVAQRMTTAQLRAELSLQSGKRKNKFNAVKTEVDGERFDSKREAAVFAEHRILERAGQIKHLRSHPKFEIAVNGLFIENYTADMSYFDMQNRLHVIDVKSPATAKTRDFKRTCRLMRAVHGITVEVIL